MGNDMKKGQLTIFIILGMVIMIFFFFLFYQTSIKKKDAVDITEDQISNMMSSLATKSFINLCIEETAKKGIYILSRQGGYIYDYQGGLVSPGYDYLAKKNMYGIITSYDFADIDPVKEYIRYNLSYGLYYNQSKNSTYISPPPPLYPADPGAGRLVDSNNYNKLLWPGYTIRKEIMPGPGYEWEEAKYYLGDVNGLFPKLCLREGDNYNISRSRLFTKSGCGDGTYGNKGENTIQEQLEAYMNNHLKECTNFRNISKVLPQFASIIVTEGNITTNILFGDTDMNIEVSYPIDIYSNGKNAKVIMKKFEVTLPIRMKQVWSHLNEVLYKDSIKFSYDKTNHTTIYGSRYWEDEFEYTITPLGYDDIYTLTDKLSLIDEDYLSFNVLIQNRRPALEYIHENFILRNDLNCFDIISWPGQKIVVTPKGYDPDEDRLNYDYQGWNEDYTSNYNKFCYGAKGPIDCTKDLRAYQQCEEKLFTGTGLKSWTGSVTYRWDNKTGEYDVKDKDIGIHILNVSVDDKELSDWQEVRILIFDSPQIIISASNPYSDISNNYTSPEDYTTISSTLTSSILSLQDFQYEAFKMDDGNLITPTAWNFSTEDEAVVQIPRKAINDNTRYPPEKIKQNMQYQFIKNTDYFLRLTASNGIEVGQSNITIEVKECLPHTSTEKPYPYNRLSQSGLDDYLADHTCCIGNPGGPASVWRIANKDEIACFNKIEYGSYKAFTHDIFKKYYADNNIPVTPNLVYADIEIIPAFGSISNSGISPNTNYDNDIFKREYTRNCDGTRGNMCNGTLSDTITAISCPDIPSGNGNRCSGPNKLIIDNVLSGAYSSCQNYIGETFESVISGDSSKSTCIDVLKCSSENKYDDITANNHYLAKATCDGSGGCTKTSTIGRQDCWQQNTCTGDTSYNHEVGESITVIKFKECVQGTASCEYYPSSIIDSECIDTYQLKEYKCKTHSEIISSQTPFNTQVYNCANAFTAHCDSSISKARPAGGVCDTLPGKDHCIPLPYSIDCIYGCNAAGTACASSP